MPVARLLFPTEVRRGVRIFDGQTFDYVLFLTPHRLGPDDHALILDILTGGKCLGITREVIEDRLRGREYTAVGKVTNRDAPDSAVGVLQYQDLCEEGRPQLWMNELCRYCDPSTNNFSQQRSPAIVLVELFEALGREYKIPAIHLAAADPVHPDIYVGYGFAGIVEGDDASRIIPEKVIDANTTPYRHRRTTRRRIMRKESSI
jgi:hypothetical protein